MYAKLCNIEVLPNYIKEVEVGDNLTVRALITNPLDWQHFYEKISVIKVGDRTDFTAVTQEGERVIGLGIIIEVDKWSNNGKYGFKIKMTVKKQKSLTDRRIRSHIKAKLPHVQAETYPDLASHGTATIVQRTSSLTATTAMSGTGNVVIAQDSNSFEDLLEESFAMDKAV
jgi:hypothetical protein